MTPPSIAAKSTWTPEPWHVNPHFECAQNTVARDLCAPIRYGNGKDPEADTERACQCVNKLAEHDDLSAVAIVPVGVMEGVKEALRIAMTAPCRSHSNENWHLISQVAQAVDALEAKADAGVQ
jgi:hypothetical protein